MTEHGEGKKHQNLLRKKLNFFVPSHDANAKEGQNSKENKSVKQSRPFKALTNYYLKLQPLAALNQFLD